MGHKNMSSSTRLRKKTQRKAQQCRCFVTEASECAQGQSGGVRNKIQRIARQSRCLVTRAVVRPTGFTAPAQWRSVMSPPEDGVRYLHKCAACTKAFAFLHVSSLKCLCRIFFFHNELLLAR
ncbi:unnamed protein product [Ixodes pacificus]